MLLGGKENQTEFYECVETPLIKSKKGMNRKYLDYGGIHGSELRGSGGLSSTHSLHHQMDTS